MKIIEGILEDSLSLSLSLSRGAFYLSVAAVKNDHVDTAIDVVDDPVVVEDDVINNVDVVGVLDEVKLENVRK